MNIIGMFCVFNLLGCVPIPKPVIQHFSNGKNLLKKILRRDKYVISNQEKVCDRPGL